MRYNKVIKIYKNFKVVRKRKEIHRQNVKISPKFFSQERAKKKKKRTKNNWEERKNNV
jgi:hypothetical protein